MCGINGFNWEDERLARRMNRAIRHRGPDDEGVSVGAGASLAQIRLSIIDLSPAGHQPMFYDRRNGAFSRTHQSALLSEAKLGIIFNGEIYNFQDVREELERKGYRFSTKSDTEVILAGYCEWGFDCVKKFNGMWAFCIHDEKKQLLFCSRDRLGVKPFYYYYKGKKFLFSSELKGILAHKALKINTKANICTDAVQLYFALGFIPAPYTIYNDVFKLEASHNLVFDLKRRTARTWRYYDLPPYKPIHDKQRLINEGRALLKDAVRLRMIADVPVGAFLSGGLDSSTIVGEMRELTDISKLHTFSIGFEGKYDESRYIHIVKDYYKTKHHHFYFTEKDFKKLLQTYAWMYDEPFGDYSGFPTYKVSEMARKDVTVCLSGDGGDEVFGGYATHVLGSRMDLIRKLPKALRAIGSKIPARKKFDNFVSLYLLKQAFGISLEEPQLFYAKALEEDGIKPPIYKTWTTEKLSYTLEKSDNSLGEALRIHDLVFNTLADNFLVKVDRASMAHALEVRGPFLDYRFAEFAQRIPTKWKAGLFGTKVLMREIIKDIVPREIVKRGKQGFSPPLEQWIRDEKYAPRLQHAVNTLKSFDPELHEMFVKKVLKGNNRVYINYKIRLFLFSLWYERWIR
jgi:asparagine synthase (glutamine-hydrolysing)